MSKVGVLGSGGVGQTLAKGFRTHGHDVRIGSRSPEKLEAFTTSAGVGRGRSRKSPRGGNCWCSRCVAPPLRRR